MPSAKVTSKGQITIPVEVREAMGLTPGVRVAFFPNADGEYLLRVRKGSIMDLRGCLAGMDAPKADQELNELLHRRAFELDEATKSAARQLDDSEAA